MTAFLVLIAQAAFKTGVASQLVLGIIAPKTPTGLAILTKLLTLSSSKMPTDF